MQDGGGIPALSSIRSLLLGSHDNRYVLFCWVVMTTDMFSFAG